MLLLSFFFASVSSIFVSSQRTTTGLFYFTKDLFDEIQNSERFMLLIIEPDSRDAEMSKASFALAATTATKPCDFAYSSIQEVYDLIGAIPFEPPFCVFFKKGVQICGFEIPVEEALVIAQVNFLLDGPSKVANSLTEINQHITSLDYTIIARVQNSDDAYNLMVSEMQQMTTCGILLASNAAFNEMGFDNESFLLFRREDTVIVPFNGTKEGLEDAMVPLYFQTVFEDFRYFTGTSIVYMQPDFHDNDDFHKIFLSVAEKYQDFHFRILVEDEFHLAERFLGRPTEEFPETAICDPIAGFYYDTREISGIPVNQTWSEKVTSILDSIIEGNLTKTYLSEPIPEGQTAPNDFTKLVGKTFGDFINDTEKDVFVMFGTPDSFRNIDETFNDIINEINAPDKVKFGTIDIFLNSHENFPEMIQIPHLELYKKGEKRETVKLIGPADPNHLRRFIKENTDLPIEAPELTEEECSYDLMFLHANLQSYSKNVIDDVNKLIEKLKTICPRSAETMETNTTDDQTQEL